MKYTFSFLIILFIGKVVAAQTPVADFSFPNPTVCLSEQILFTNQSTNATQYEWDFCADDFYSLKSLGNVSPVNTISYGTGFKLVEDNGLWTGFALGTFSHNLIRFDFGGSPFNSPTVVDLGNPSSALAFPRGIELIKQQGSWYGFISNNSSGAGVTLLNFGPSLTNSSPSVQSLGNFGVSDRIWDTKVVTQGADYILVFAVQGTNQIVRVNFRDSFANSTTGFVYTGSIPGPNTINGIDLVWTGTAWKVLVLSSGTNQIYQFDFGNDLLGPFTQDGVYSSVVSQPYKIAILKEADNYFATVSGQATGDIRIFNFNDMNPANVPTVLPHTTIATMIGIDAIRFMGKSVLMGVGTTSYLEQALFESDCGAAISYSTVPAPTGIAYTQSGLKKIELVATNSTSGESSSQGQGLTVSTNTSPDISFTSQNVCVNNNVDFTSQNTSGDITSYAWDFGDGSGTLPGNNPTYVYTTAANYLVTLNVNSSNGCSNFVQNTLPIFNPPQSNFTLPLSSPICTNLNYVFTNTSTFDNGSNPAWQWSVNGTNVATTRDLNYLISSPVSQSVTLIASIPGCSSQVTQSISTVKDGPLVNFNSPTAGCVNAVASFVNTSSGTVTNYSWDFGDGNTSSQTNAVNTYASTGIYAVTLTASNAAGCQNFSTRSFPVYSAPQPNFAIEAPPYSCANYPAQFDNNTPPLPDSNITTWAWSFGDAANGTSNQKNPAYTYPSALTYEVTLQATTNFGCTTTTHQSVIIYSSPQAAFTNSPACVNQNTQFTDASSGNIATYQWLIQGTLFTGTAPPPYVFKSTGTFPVTLTTIANNGCKNQVIKNITVPVPPVMDFIFQPSCAGKPIVFQELNPGGPDAAVAWNWNFGADSGTGSPVNYLFTTAGGYSVTLSSTRTSGCVYSTSKNITIYDGPTASFIPSVQGGAAPLTVNFSNTSVADSYFWQFDAGNSTSNDVSPAFTYTELGEYKVLLTASNIHGCIDTVSTKIYVVVPHVDLAMKNFSLVVDPISNTSKAVVTILNLGNIPATNPEVQIDLGGNALLKEKITSTVLPGKSIQQTLSLEIVPKSLGYICAAVAPAGDVDVYNDSQCISLTNSDILFYPYPNPAKSQINFDWISSENENVIVTIYKSTGQVAFQQNFPTVQPGINQLAIDISSLSSGLYLIQFSGAKAKKTFSVSVIN